MYGNRTDKLSGLNIGKMMDGCPVFIENVGRHKRQNPHSKTARDAIGAPSDTTANCMM